MASKWEPHKSRIKELYLDQNKKLDEVMYILKNENGFTASKTEYERRLKVWDFGKSMKQEHVKFLKRRLERRRQQGKGSEVVLRGILIPKLEIQRKTNRCFMSTVERLERCTTPPGMLVITPTSESYMECVRCQELPWIYFQGQLRSFDNLHIIINMPEGLMRAMIPSLCPDISPQVSEHVKEILHYLCAILPFEQDENIMNVLGKIFGGDYRHATIEFLKLAVYLLSNKLLTCQSDLGDIFCNKLLNWFQLGRNRMFLRAILSEKTPTIAAFVEVIFSSAVRYYHEILLSLFLESGVDPDLLIHYRGSGREPLQATPLSWAAKEGKIGLAKMLLGAGGDVDVGDGAALREAARSSHLEVAQLLITAGARVNHHGEESPSALQIAAWKGNLDISRLLLDNGANLEIESGNFPCVLSCAIDAGNHDLYQLLLDRGANVNGKLEREKSLTPLQSAARRDNLSLVKDLLQFGADANSQAPSRLNSGGVTALQSACENGNLEMSHELIRAGADVNAEPHEFGMTALSGAVFSMSYDLIELLLQHGADVHDQRGIASALEEAIARKDVKMVKRLLLVDADPNQDRVIVGAIHTQDFEIIETLMEAGADFKSKFNKALYEAVRTQNIELVQFVLDVDATSDRNLPKLCLLDTINCYFNLALIQAVCRRNLPLVEILLNAGAPCRHEQTHASSPFENHNALQQACLEGNVELVQYLLNAGALINWPAASEYGQTALQAAVSFGDIDLVQFLINKGADVNAPPAYGEDGVTALQAAVSKKRRDLVHVLLEAGAHSYNEVISETEGRTSLQLAARFGDNDLIELLLKCGANVNEAPALYSGQTALQAACESGHYQTVQLLLDKGADVNGPISEYGGRTALHNAAFRGYLRIAKILLCAGARVNVVCKHPYIEEELTALDIAAESGSIDMLKLLLNAGANIIHGEESAIYVAEENGHHAAAKFLKYHQMC